MSGLSCTVCELFCSSSRDPSPETKAGAIRDLAAAVRSGMTLTDALLTWDHDKDDSLSDAAAAVRRRIKLGASLRTALEPLEASLGADFATLQVVSSLHLRLGGDVAAMLDSVASSIQRRAGELGAAKSHAAGARLSGRMVAGLPLAFLPLAPMSRAPMADTPGALMLLGGLCLAVMGLMWMGKLLPQPSPAMPSHLLVTSLLATALGAGIETSPALTVIASEAPEGLACELGRAARRASLGESWSQALGESDDEGLAAIGATLARSMRFGVPAGSALMRLERSSRATAAREFDAQIRRAAVRMVVPLTICVLPSFVLLALGPFVRGLSG